MAAPKKPRRRGNREGSIYFDKRLSLWRVAVSPLPGMGGRRRYASAKTKAEAMAKRSALMAEMGEGVGGGLVPTLAEYVPSWLEGRRAARRRETTIRNYISALQVHVLPDLGRMRLDALTAPVLQGWINRRLAAGLSPSQARRIATVLGSVLGSAERLRIIARSPIPLLELPAYAPPPARYLDLDGAARFYQAAAADPLAALFLLLVTTGLRIGEALALRWEDVAAAPGGALEIGVSRQIQKPRGGWSFTSPKTGRSRRVFAPPTVALALAAWRKRQDALGLPDDPPDFAGLIFRRDTGEPMHANTVRGHLARVLAAAGLGHITIHQLRHSAGSLMLAMGIDIMTISRVLGHATTAQTSRTYVHVVDELLRRAAAAAGRAMEPPEGDQNEPSA